MVVFVTTAAAAVAAAAAKLLSQHLPTARPTITVMASRKKYHVEYIGVGIDI